MSCSGGVFCFLFALTWLEQQELYRRRENLLGQMGREVEIFLEKQRGLCDLN